jgi:hypothetical protein
LTNTKRLGRFSSSNNTSDSPSYFDRLASFYEDKGQRRSLSDWDKPLFLRRGSSLEKVLAQANKTLEKSNRFVDKIKSKEIACSNRAKSIPENATIRKEFIKCGKTPCYHGKHGPYYYAYWKDPETKKLKKKYIGTRMPESKVMTNDADKVT